MIHIYILYTNTNKSDPLKGIHRSPAPTTANPPNHHIIPELCMVDIQPRQLMSSCLSIVYSIRLRMQFVEYPE